MKWILWTCACGRRFYTSDDSPPEHGMCAACRKKEGLE